MNVLHYSPSNDVNIRGRCSGASWVQPNWEALLRMAPGNVSKPSLAESWETQDAQTYIFKLRKDVQWHDGKPFTSADVVATLEHFMRISSPPHNNLAGKFLKDNGATFRAVDPNTVELKLKEPNVTTVGMFSSCSAMMGSKAIIDKNGGPQEEWALGKEGEIKDTIGTGPYKLVKNDRDVEILFDKNPNYWGRDASGGKLPYLDGLHVFVIRDSALQIAAFRTNQVDMWPTGWPVVAKSDADTLKSQLGDKIVVTPGNAALFESLDLNNNHPLLKQRDMRRAMNLIIDRQELTQRAAEGNLIPTIVDPELFGKAALPLEEVAKMPGFRQPKTEDHAEARRLLQKLGIAPQTPVELSHQTRNSGFQLGAAQVIAKQLEPFGIKVKNEVMEVAAVGALQQQGNWTMNADPDSIAVLDPWFFMQQEADFSYRTGGFAWADEAAQKKIIDLRQQAMVTLDEAKRNALYQEIQRYLYTVDAPHIALGWDRTHHMWWNHVKGYEIVGGIIEGRQYDTVWLDK